MSAPPRSPAHQFLDAGSLALGLTAESQRGACLGEGPRVIPPWPHRRGQRELIHRLAEPPEPGEHQAQAEARVVVARVPVRQLFEHRQRIAVAPSVEQGAPERLLDARRLGCLRAGVRQQLRSCCGIPTFEQGQSAPVPVIDLPGRRCPACIRLWIPLPVGHAPTLPQLQGAATLARTILRMVSGALPPTRESPAGRDRDSGASSHEEWHDGLDVRAFRGLRFDPARVRALAAVTSPPYDVVEADGVLRLETQDPHNVVRLILPRADDCGPDGRYARAAQRLRSWRADGTVVTDPEPAIYVYEQAADDVTVRGVIGSLRLRAPADRVVLPHEDVMPAPVQDRLALLAATRANLEPVLLVHDGDSASADVVEQVTEVAMRVPPIVDATTPDGARHRLWPVTDVVQLHRLTAAFAARHALIADGHHRWAACLALAAAQRAAGAGAGPWDRTLALLVDSRRFPLQLRAIHRVVAAMSVHDAVRSLGPGLTARAVPAHDLAIAAAAGRLEHPAAALEHHAASHPASRAMRPSFAGLPDGVDSRARPVPGAPAAFALLDAEEAFLVDADPPPSLATALLHEDVIPCRWGISEDRLSYHHEVRDAIAAARTARGLAVLLPAVALEQVLKVAAEGRTMPRKTTSFGPKPRSGLIMRAFDLEQQG